MLGISNESIRNGLFNMKLEGRFEKIKEGIYVDGGHNPQGAESIVKAIEFHNIENPVFIISMVKDKDMEKYLEIISKNGKVILTSFDSELCHNPYEFPELESMDFDDTIRLAKRESKDNTYIFCGSLYQISSIYRKLDEIS